MNNIIINWYGFFISNNCDQCFGANDVWKSKSNTLRTRIWVGGNKFNKSQTAGPIVGLMLRFIPGLNVGCTDGIMVGLSFYFFFYVLDILRVFFF